jgi:DNA-binding transcriptional MerR regulator
MYKIGEFSKITGISIKALHYYDKENLIIPAQREGNSYRIYDEHSFNRAILIKKLRSYDFTIAEIKDAISLCSDEGELEYILNEKIVAIREDILRKKKLINKINKEIKLHEKETQLLENKINIISVPEVRIASIKYTGRYNECGDYFRKIMQGVKELSCGVFICLFYEMAYCETATIEACVPVKKNISSRKISNNILPPVKAVSYIHCGSYETINKGYKKIFDYAALNDLELGLPSRELYHKGPGLIFKGNPNHYKTEIIYPIIESKGLNEKTV